MSAKIVIVTGGSSGIGLSIINQLSKLGHIAVSWDLNPPLETVPFIHCDVTNEQMVKKALSETISLYGTPSVLINNCGVQFLSPVEEFPIEKWNHLISILLTGTFICSKYVIPEMKKNNWGRIVNVSSIHGKVASPFKSAYVAAKHGVLGLSKVMALELAEHNITVNSICPGFVDTPLMRQQMSKQAQLNQMTEDQVAAQIMLKPACIKKFTTTDQVASMVKYLISDDASTITGEAFSMSGGWGMGQ
jgi:3-hydroxybutyrate dehydrogenase